MEKIKRSLQESIVLHNLFISIYTKMNKEKDKPFFKLARNFSRTNYTDLSNAVIREVQVNLVKEIMVLINQMWANNSNRFDESLIKNKFVYNSIKSQISEGEKFPFNNRELFKRIRESIAHNSKNIQNCVYDLHGFELNLGKVDGEDYIIKLDLNQMVELFQVLLLNRKTTHDSTKIIINEFEPPVSREEIAENIKIVDTEKETVSDLDNNQIERFYNYFKYVEPNKPIEGNEQELQLVFSFKNNAERMLLEKISALKIISQMDSGSALNHLEYKSNMQKINTYMAVVSNLFFNIASSLTNQEISELFEGTIANLDEEKIRHLRNALCHGRYFHNFNDTFYFYDGRKNLTFKLKLTIVEINKILDKIAKGGFSVVALA